MALLVVPLLFAFLAACWGPLSGDTGSCAGASLPVEVVTESQIDEVPEGASNLVLDISSSLTEQVRLTIRVDRDLALDVRVPGTATDCVHPPVNSYAYDLPDRRVTVTVVTDRGQRGAASLELGAKKQWVVVQLQEGFPLHVEAWDSEPAWG